MRLTGIDTTFTCPHMALPKGLMSSLLIMAGGVGTGQGVSLSSVMEAWIHLPGY
jgi:hypothetical protein